MKPRLVLLAAGASERLGSCKALVDLAGRTPLQRLLEAGREACDGPPLIVSGAHHVEIVAAAPRGTRVLHNPSWRAGRSAGLALAASLSEGRDLCVAPVDVPLVPARVFTALAREWERLGEPPGGWLGPRLLASGHPDSGRFGHPIVIGSALAGQLGRLEPDLSLRSLRADADPLCALDVADPEILDDLDTPRDLALLRNRLAGSDQA